MYIPKKPWNDADCHSNIKSIILSSAILVNGYSNILYPNGFIQLAINVRNNTFVKVVICDFESLNLVHLSSLNLKISRNKSHNNVPIINKYVNDEEPP